MPATRRARYGRRRAGSRVTTVREDDHAGAGVRRGRAGGPGPDVGDAVADARLGDGPARRAQRPHVLLADAVELADPLLGQAAGPLGRPQEDRDAAGAAG